MFYFQKSLSRHSQENDKKATDWTYEKHKSDKDIQILLKTQQ